MKTFKTKKAINKLWALIVVLVFALVGGVVVWKSLAETYTATNFAPVGIASAGTNNGYWLASSDGGVFSYGSAHYYGSMGGKPLNAPIVGIAATPGGGGYWLVGADGGIFSFGNAKFYGSMGGRTLNAPIVGIAATPDGGGYWLVGADGGVFSFGDAQYEGSLLQNSTPLASQYGEAIVGISSTTSGDNGYYIVSNYGEVWAYGNAPDSGQNGHLVVSRRGAPYVYGQSYATDIVGIATDPAGGIWTIGADGGIFSYHGAFFYGSMGGKALNKPMIGMAATPNGGGYWSTAGDGGVFAFGNAQYQGRDYYNPPPTTTPTAAPTPPPPTASSGPTTTKTYQGTIVTYIGGKPVLTATPIQVTATGVLNTGAVNNPKVNAPIVSGLATSSNGYLLVGSNGGVYSRGSAVFRGSLGSKTIGDIVSSVSTPDHGGGWRSRRWCLCVWQC